jgi:hypothetical protein
VRDLHYLVDDVYLLDELAPGQTYVFPKWELDKPLRPAPPRFAFPVTTEFTDGAGLRWQRHNRGQPKRA